MQTIYSVDTHSSVTDLLICNPLYRICLYNLADLSYRPAAEVQTVVGAIETGARSSFIITYDSLLYCRPYYTDDTDITIDRIIDN